MNLPPNLEKILFQTVKMMKTDVSSDINQEHNRTRNTNWCTCGHCQVIETEITESEGSNISFQSF